MLKNISQERMVKIGWKNELHTTMTTPRNNLLIASSLNSVENIMTQQNLLGECCVTAQGCNCILSPIDHDEKDGDMSILPECIAGIRSLFERFSTARHFW